ncbi:MAG TPA: PIG-L family deacetylase [Segetibacter sp.]|jgi:LmbE family N-acetylglucosaminyl deacetylase
MKKLIASFFVFTVFFLCSYITNAQAPPAPTSAEIYSQIKKLNVLGSVLYIAAHPDDENNSLLPYLAKEKLYRTAYLSITRGDGGQNLIGSEQGVELGLIRTQELLAARRIDGAEQYFTRAYEFGYSKSAEESLRFWDKEKILGDVVWVIRQYQPDIIIKRFPPDARAGHGHHAASSILADEAFIAAADPKRFPEQFNYGVKPWQAKRVLWNGFNFGTTNTTSLDQLKIDVGIYNPLLGKSYGEIGGEARSMHKSQGEGRPRRRGEILEYFTTTGGEPAKNDLMEGVATDWSRIDGGANIQSSIKNVITTYNFSNPELSVPALLNIYRSVKALPESNWRNKKLAEIQNIIEACSGLFTEAVTAQEYAVQGDSLKVAFNFNNRGSISAQVKNVTLTTSTMLMQQQLATVKTDANTRIINSTGSKRMPVLDSTTQLKLDKNKNTSINYSFKLEDAAPRSEPYWLQSPMKQGYFDVMNQFLIGQAETRSSYIARFLVDIEGQEFLIERDVQFKVTDPVRGEVYQPLLILPKVTLAVLPTLVLPNVKHASSTGKSTVYSPSLTVNYTSNIDASKVPLSLTMQNGFRTDVLSDVVVDLKKGATYSIPVKVKDVYYQGARKHIDPVLALKLNGKEVNFTQNFKTIRYDHISTLHYFYNDNLKVVDEEIKTAGKNVGYIVGAGDKVPDALAALGYNVTFITEEDLAQSTLQKFDAIVVGIRAHNIYEYLTTKNDILNQYVQNGGNLIVQYIKSNTVGAKRVKIGPYPFTISTGSRVTEEDAKVNFLLPNHAALNFPNKITSKDFEGWVQERSTYQVDQAGPEFERLIAMNDTGEKESNGSLAIAKYGKGNFAYVSLVLFRQLPAGVAGAYKLMANLIALPKNK